MTSRVVILAVMLAGVSHASSTFGQGSVTTRQADLARDIASPASSERRAALANIDRRGPEGTGDSLRLAMFAQLRRESEEHRQRYQAASRGLVSNELDDPEFVADLALSVIRLHDARTIPALASALSGAPVIAFELARFGELAVGPVLDVVTNRDAWYDEVAGGLIALRLMVEQTPERPLSRAALARIRAATTQRLDGPQYFTSLWRAMDLASVLREPALTVRLERFASAPSETYARGIDNQDIVEATQRRAADLLAGKHPLPTGQDLAKALP